jgi:hypothetical protein
MILVDHFGLPIVEATVDEALALTPDLPAPAGTTLVRVVEPPAASWPDLAAAGFLRKPAWVTWLAAAGTDTEYVGRLSRKSRQDLRRAWGRAEDAELRIEVQEPVEEENLDTFLDLYEERVEEMTYGVAFARQCREEILHGGQDYAVLAFEGPRLVGGCLCQRSPEADAVRLRFSAVEPRWREASLARVLYMRAHRTAHEQGFRWVTLGNDPNLYGHMTKPGLFYFKARLGFDPVPAGLLGPRHSGDVADRLLSLDRLTDPTVMLGYPERVEHAKAGPSDLVAYVFGSDPHVDRDRYTTGRVRTVRLIELPVGTHGNG